VLAKRHQGSKKHQQRDPLRGITDPAIKRLSKRGGIKRLEGPVYDATRNVIRIFLENVVRDAVTYTEYADRKTVVADDINRALKRHGQPLYGYSASSGKSKKSKKSKKKVKKTDDSK